MDLKEAKSFQDKLDEVINAVEIFGSASTQLKIATSKLDDLVKSQNKENNEINDIIQTSEIAENTARKVLDGSFYSELNGALVQLNKSAQDMESYAEMYKSKCAEEMEKVQELYDALKEQFDYENIKEDTQQCIELIDGVDKKFSKKFKAIEEELEKINYLTLQSNDMDKKLDHIEKCVNEIVSVLKQK